MADKKVHSTFVDLQGSHKKTETTVCHLQSICSQTETYTQRLKVKSFFNVTTLFQQFHQSIKI